MKSTVLDSERRVNGGWKRRAIPSAFLLILLASLLSQSVFAAELTIQSAHRIIDINPAGFRCNGWSYGAMPIVNEAGTVDTIYSAGDVLTNHCHEGLDSPNRFGDRIWRHTRNADGTWSGNVVIGRDAFPWVSANHPESYVSHLASPAVVRIGGRWFMAVVASVSDPNLCAAEHGAPTTCGSCASPWSHFAVMWAVSDDGIHWRVREGGGDNANPALAASVLWREPAGGDTTAPSNYKSFARVSMVTGTDNGKTYFYLLGMFWGKSLLKETLVRIPYDAADPWGLGGDAEVLRYVPQDMYAWDACPHGRLPEWLDTQSAYSIVNGFFNAFTSSVFTTTSVPGYRYVALGVANFSQLFGYGSTSSLIVYSLSNDLIHWTGQRPLRSGVPYFADGLGYTGSVIDPIAVEDPGGHLHLYLTSNDDNSDGAGDCPSNSGFGATAIYVGTGIYEAELSWEELPYTTIALSAPAPTVTTGTWHFPITVTSIDGTLPNGVVWAQVLDDLVPSSSSAKIINGKGDLLVTLRSVGTRSISVGFNTLGPWTICSTNVRQVVVPPAHHRAAGH
jgi:hypothetical protein